MSSHINTVVKSVIVSVMLVGVIGMIGDPSNLTGYDVFGVGFLAFCFAFLEIPKEK